MRGSPGGSSFEIYAQYEGLSDEQRGLFIGSLMSWDSCACRYKLVYTPPSLGERRGHSSRCCGPQSNPDPEPEARALIRHVYLPPLRDAVRELASSNPGRLELLLQSVATAESKADFIQIASSSLQKIEKHNLLDQAISLLTQDIEQLTTGVQRQTAHLHFADATLASLARDLRLSLSAFGLPRVDLRESGLGYTNLLYLACVLVELRKAKDHELTLFLVEEPEAHLHPQLQTATLSYLQEQARKSVSQKGKQGQHEGRIQVIVSTHSPVLTARVSPLHLVILSPEIPVQTLTSETVKDESEDKGSILEAASVAGCEPRVVALRRLNLPANEVRKLQRYLDVTRGSLLFSRRVLLVEGISDAIMLGEFGRILFEGHSQKMAEFRAATIIPVGGVDFAPFVRLLLTSDIESKCCIASRVVVLTDEDPDCKSATRPSDLTALGIELKRTSRLSVHVCPITLEAALMTKDTKPALRDAYVALHSRSSEKWDQHLANADEGSSGKALVALLKQSDSSKPEFSQLFVEEFIKHNLGAEMIPSIFCDALNDLLVAGK